MTSNETAEGPDGLPRVVVAAGLAAVALVALRIRKRTLAALIGAGAIAVGYIATAGSRDADARERDGETTSQATTGRGGLRCSVCGEPIRPGQGRRPDEDHETVHDACLE